MERSIPPGLRQNVLIVVFINDHPSNTSELVRARFSQESMDEAFTQLVSELQALQFLDARPA